MKDDIADGKHDLGTAQAYAESIIVRIIDPDSYSGRAYYMKLPQFTMVFDAADGERIEALINRRAGTDRSQVMVELLDNGDVLIGVRR